ncbi:MAG: TRAP transporter substrate-binding protein [Aurantimonas endophytica]|uniref:Tripartite ATP-independent transporter DctP family solute receptor n=1 Tax=Aurantimonas endophytica TaxID=1522175 RepID=A0A7W6MPX2_9HYPH|nr:TRAP transporter substrate-binding protein [Aurantimonas endophytica]MBB4003395.1 tripartite ATP-independent transporter DctP family solute receptor [Aurantimonas endophytica]MCO6404256.1 DctP family TRAP transporter solute-binding subunit [Aurantimonas endophytica]
MSQIFRLNRRAVLAGGLAAPFVLRSPFAFAATELRLTHPADASHPIHTAAEAMAARVAERTGGEITISIFPSNALGSPTDTAQQTRLGAIDFILMNPANIEALSNSIGAINIPYQFDDYAHAHRVLDETARDWIEAQLLEAGFAWIANFEWGFRALSNSRRPVNAPEDVTGLKIRVPPELAIKAAFEALGASTQTVAFQEVYLALANGLVDGQDNPVSTTFAAKFYEAQDHLALTKHIYATIMMCANPRVWNGLTEEQRAIISEEAATAGAAAREEVQSSEEDYITQMEGLGVAVTRPEVEPFRARMEPAYAQLRAALGEETWTTWAGLVEAGKA